jgi:monovalent cation:H+ antiporter, CPA1 family
LSQPGFFDFAAMVLLLAAGVGWINEITLQLPRAIALLSASLILSLAILLVDHLLGIPLVAFLRASLDAADLPHVFLDGALALLLFAGTLQVDVKELRRWRWSILALSTASVVIATACFAFGIWAVFAAVGMPVPLGWCAVLGAILSPTDAVVVHALLERLPLPAGLRATIAGESLFNDGAGVVLFLVALAMAAGETGLIGRGHILAALTEAGLGGAAIGAACGVVASLALHRTAEPVLQLTISLALAVGSYRIAEYAAVSGPIAVVVAGLVMSGRRAGAERSIAPELGAFWALLDELLNAILFLLLGLQVLGLPGGPIAVLPIILAIPLALASRCISVALPVALGAADFRAGSRAVAVMVWSGLRGGVSIALALVVPDSPSRNELLAICYTVVVFTILVQGLTIAPLLRRLYPPATRPNDATPALRSSR